MGPEGSQEGMAWSKVVDFYAFSWGIALKPARNLVETAQRKSQDRGNNHIADTNTLWQRNGKLPNGYIDPDKRL
jgi:hypothetical protein